MKKLAILSSLALLVAPSFKGNAFTDLARNQIKMIDEAGDSSSSYEVKTGTILFGTQKDTNAATTPIETSHYLVSGFDELKTKPTLKFTGSYAHNYTRGNSESSNYALLFGKGSSARNITITFADAIIKTVKINASAASDGQKKGTITVASDNGYSKEPTSVSEISYSDYSFDDICGDSNNTSNTITITGVAQKNSNITISEINVDYLVPASKTSTVTYNYGNSLENADFSTNSVEVTKGETTSSPLEDGYAYTDWDGTRELVGWYTDEEKTSAFDFATSITEDITLYAKWKVTADSTEVTNLKTSETKSQLYYEYSNKTYVETTESVTFGTVKTSSTTGLDTISNFTASDGAGIKTITGQNVYQDGANYDIKMSSSSKNGTLTFNFNTETVVEKVIVYAISYRSDKTSSLKVSSNNSKTTSPQTIKYSESHDNDVAYTFTGLDKDEKASSLSITLSATERLYVSKVEFVIAKEEASTDFYNITNIGLRFGGLVKQSYFDSLKGHITNFGLIYATDLGDHKTLADALNDESVTTTKLNQTITSEVTPYLTTVDDDGYYVFNAFFNVSSTSESITKVVYAIATLTLDNGETIYFKEKSNSVATIAKEYLDTNKYDGAVKETLTLLSQGKTKTTDTTESN